VADSCFSDGWFCPSQFGSEGNSGSFDNDPALGANARDDVIALDPPFTLAGRQGQYGPLVIFAPNYRVELLSGSSRLASLIAASIALRLATPRAEIRNVDWPTSTLLWSDNANAVFRSPHRRCR